MTEDKEGYRFEEVDKKLVNAIVAFLIQSTQGPSMAWAIIACVIHEILKLNKDATGKEVPVNDLLEELTSSVFSIRDSDESIQ